ncbi:MAG: hypothetical protein WDO56_07950 [Gammaproteobacteria bacterium]
MIARKLITLAVAVAMLFGLQASTIAQNAKPMTNQDVIKMVQAKLSEDTIAMAVRAAKPGFDTSADGLVKLSTAGVPDGVIKAIIEAKSGGGSASSAGSASAPAGKAAVANAFNPEEVILIDGDKHSTMRYIAPQMRTAARALGFGGVGSYAALSGTAATLRLKNTSPSFMVAVPTNAQPEGYVTLANFAVRKNGTREVQVGGGYMSYSTGINKDRVMPITVEKLPDQSKAPKDFIIYRVNVAKPLAGGEYAFILYNSQVKVVGYFLSGADSYFDFGVDP